MPNLLPGTRQYHRRVSEDTATVEVMGPQRAGELLRCLRYKNARFVLHWTADDPDRWLQVEVTVDDVRQRGRKWRLSAHMTDSEVVQTAFAAVLAWEEHEAREAFHFRDIPVFSPHFCIEDLVALARYAHFDARGPLPR